jgi:serine/threonine-protein kinase
VSVPDLVLAPTTDAARHVLEEAGLGARVQEVASESVPADDIVGQFPESGALVAPGSSVRVDVSSGPPEIAVPNVVDMSVADATAALEALGFRVNHDPLQGGDIVLSQQPLPGQTESPGFTVAIFS